MWEDFHKGDPAVPVWFGMLMTRALKDSQAARSRELRRVKKEGRGAKGRGRGNR